MAISSSQLETWSHQGAITNSATTYNSIKTAIESSNSLIKDRDHKVYLQGSYKNSTNIRGNSDVDVVLQLNSTFRSDLNSLSEKDKSVYHSKYPDAKYNWPDFRRDVLSTLREYYGASQVTEGDKSIKIGASSNRLASDVVVCITYRKYISMDP
ncbi:MAG: nucleotidyltransferase [Chloroflexi bacterium]|nr:MAG: nucleotidyltransferase [Chloroflexota bacterium]